MLARHEILTDLAWHEILHRHFRPSQSRKWITAKWLTAWQTRPILIYFEFISKPSLITVICMDPHSPNKLFATKYCFVILGDDTSFFFLIISVFVVFLLFYAILCYFVIINFYKNYFIIIILFNQFFFSWKLFLIFHAPGCSGMFRVPGFIDGEIMGFVRIFWKEQHLRGLLAKN